MTTPALARVALKRLRNRCNMAPLTDAQAESLGANEREVLACIDDLERRVRELTKGEER